MLVGGHWQGWLLLTGSPWKPSSWLCLIPAVPHICTIFATYIIACVASVSVRFRSKERPRNGILSFNRARNETRAKKWKWGEGVRKEGNACRQTPQFWKPAFASERSTWLARLDEQCWHVSIKGLFHTERTVWYVTRKLIFSGCCFGPSNARTFSLTSFETKGSSCD